MNAEDIACIRVPMLDEYEVDNPRFDEDDPDSTEPEFLTVTTEKQLNDALRRMRDILAKWVVC